jgi:hypothetical protein
MKASKRVSSAVLAAVAPMILFACVTQMSAAPKSPEGNIATPQWSVQVDKVDPGDVSIEPAFRIAIYENLLQELSKTKRFQQVFRSGDRGAGDVSDLLILKTKVEKYTAGSETRRAVTTVSGATKLSVRTQLCTRDGQIILEKVIDGNVRFIGGNLRATNNLARNVANEIKRSTLPQAKVPEKRSEEPAVSASRIPF